MANWNWYGYRWRDLERKAPIDIEGVCRPARKLTEKLRLISTLDIEPGEIDDIVHEILGIRSVFETMLLNFLEIVRRGAKTNDRIGKIAYLDLKYDLRYQIASMERQCNNLDKVEGERMGKMLKTVMSRMETVLFGIIWYSLKGAIDREKNKEKFPFALWSFAKRKTGIMNQLSKSLKGKKGDFSGSETADYEELLEAGEKGEGELKKALKDVGISKDLMNKVKF